MDVQLLRLPSYARSVLRRELPFLLRPGLHLYQRRQLQGHLIDGLREARFVHNRPGGRRPPEDVLA